MTDERIDFGPLDPRSAPEGFDRVVRSITDAAGEELGRRRGTRERGRGRERDGVFAQLAGWRRPLLAAAAIAAVVSVGTLVGIDPPAGSDADEIGVPEALGVPDAIASWVRSGETPTTAELLTTALEDGG